MLLNPVEVDVDKSPKGTIDPLIFPFMELINATKDYKTTSSCSGRISVFVEKGTEKGFWAFVSHERVPTIKFTQNIVYDGDIPENLPLVSFKFEPFILHISASLENATSLLQVCFDAGYRYSALVNGKKQCMLQIKSSLKLDAPIGYYQKDTDTIYMIVSPSYIELLVNLSNQKFDKNEERMDILLQKFKTYFDNTPSN
ncbi:hypothetical protein HDV02_001148 [Globomyces sp. JEL0801]|nr:hypothetical protein HDV02_001148 [Globomyces sp. JEL0801]